MQICFNKLELWFNSYKVLPKSLCHISESCKKQNISVQSWLNDLNMNIKPMSHWLAYTVAQQQSELGGKSPIWSTTLKDKLQLAGAAQMQCVVSVSQLKMIRIKTVILCVCQLHSIIFCLFSCSRVRHSSLFQASYRLQSRTVELFHSHTVLPSVHAVGTGCVGC